MKTPKPPTAPKDVREARQAAALKANLKRRKSAAAKPELLPEPGPESAPRPYWVIRELMIRDRDTGVSKLLQIELSSPFTADGMMWGCALKMAGAGGAFDREHGRMVFGADGGQALELSLKAADWEMERIGENRDVTWTSGEPYDPSFRWADAEAAAWAQAKSKDGG